MLVTTKSCFWPFLLSCLEYSYPRITTKLLLIYYGSPLKFYILGAVLSSPLFFHAFLSPILFFFKVLSRYVYSLSAFPLTCWFLESRVTSVYLRLCPQNLELWPAHKKYSIRTFPVVKWLGFCLPAQGVLVQFLAGELRSHMFHGK